MLTYRECFILFGGSSRLHGKLACTQVKCSWIVPTYVNEEPYARVKGINFSSAKKLKENFDQKIDNLDNLSQPTISSQPEASHSRRVSSSGAVSASSNLRPLKGEIDELHVKLNKCKIKAVALSLIPPFADQLVDESRLAVCFTLLHGTVSALCATEHEED